MTALIGSSWLDENVWPQIQKMLLQDAYFKLMGHARTLTGKFNGPLAWLIYSTFVTSQLIAIRALCDPDRKVISLRRVIEESKDNPDVKARYDDLMRKLADCDTVCELTNQHIAHAANPARNPNMKEWNLTAEELARAHKAICGVAIILARILLNRNFGEILPIQQSGDQMEDFRLWVADENIAHLWNFWHQHRAIVNSWIP